MKRLGNVQKIAIISLACLGLAVPIVLAQSTGTEQNTQQESRGERRGHGKHWGGQGGKFDHGLLRGVTLTEDQKTRMKQITDSFRQSTEPLRQQVRAKRQELRQASEGGTFNEALATQKLTEAASLEAKLMGERFRMRQEIQSLLTPEQKAQMEQAREQFKARRAERGGRQEQ